MSWGFLDGLPSILANAHPSSDLVQDVEIVAWTSLGNQFAQSNFLVMVRRQYVSLLHSFQVLLQTCQVFGPSVEALVIAVLLSLYEIVSSGELPPEQHKHVAHV